MKTCAGRYMRSYRAEQNMNQAELAAKLSVAQSTVSDIENGVQNPSLKTARKFSALSGIDIGLLYAEDNEPEAVYA